MYSKIALCALVLVGQGCRSSSSVLTDELLVTTAEARAVAERLAARDPSAASNVALALLHFTEGRALTGLELNAAKAAIDTLLSAYRAQASAMGLLERATTLHQWLTAR
jgi:hypothetical protein